MGVHSKIGAMDEKIQAAILDMSARGLGCGTIVKNLSLQYKVNLTIPTVRTWLHNKKLERKEISTAAYATAIGDSAAADMQIIDVLIKSLVKNYETAVKEGKARDAVLFGDSLLRYVKTRIDLSGVTEKKTDKDDMIENARINVLKKLQLDLPKEIVEKAAKEIEAEEENNETESGIVESDQELGRM